MKLNPYILGPLFALILLGREEASHDTQKPKWVNGLTIGVVKPTSNAGTKTKWQITKLLSQWIYLVLTFQVFGLSYDRRSSALSFGLCYFRLELLRLQLATHKPVWHMVLDSPKYWVLQRHKAIHRKKTPTPSDSPVTTRIWEDILALYRWKVKYIYSWNLEESMLPSLSSFSVANCVTFWCFSRVK